MFVCSHIIFPLISAPGAHSILKLQGAALIGVWHLKEGSTYFKIRGIIHMKFQYYSHEITISL